MSRILTMAIAALMFAGCASEPGYDKSAVRDAAAAMRRATAVCEKEKTASKLTACEVAAQRDYAVAIHLPKIEAFDSYAAQMQALAADWDAGRVGRRQLAARADSIRKDYRLACDCLKDRRTSDWNPFVPSSDLTPPGVQLSPSHP